jgi:hypothetical protein
MKPEEINYGKQNTWHYEAFSRLLEFEQGRQMRCRSTRPAACRLVLIEILTDRAKLEQILKIFVLRGPVACLKKRKENRPVSFIVPKELLQCRHDPYFL